MTFYGPFRCPSVAVAALAGLVLQLGSTAVLADTATSSEDSVYAPLVVARAANAVRQERVSFGGLDLSAELGLSVLKRRITLAAGRVCGGADIRDLGALRAERLCRESAFAGAMAQVDAIIARTRVATL